MGKEMMFVDYMPCDECQNDECYCTCLKCGKCGRKFNEYGMMIGEGNTHVSSDEDEISIDEAKDALFRVRSSNEGYPSEAIHMAIEALEFIEELKEHLAEIDDADDDASAEIICRKLLKHNLIKLEGDRYILT